MELYKKIIEIIDVNLIYCLIPIILTLILCEVFFKNRFEIKNTLNLVSWIIIIYTITIGVFYLIGIALNLKEYSFINQVTESYTITHWIIILSTLILPFTLLIKNLASKFWYVLLVAFAMKIGAYFERFVIIVTSYHQDYLTESENTEFIDSFLFGIGLTFLQGVIITILTLGTFEIIKRKN